MKTNNALIRVYTLMGTLSAFVLLGACATTYEPAKDAAYQAELENFSESELDWSLTEESPSPTDEEEILREGNLARGRHDLFERRKH